MNYLKINRERLAALSIPYDPIAGDSLDHNRVPHTIPGTDRTAYIRSPWQQTPNCK